MPTHASLTAAADTVLSLGLPAGGCDLSPAGAEAVLRTVAVAAEGRDEFAAQQARALDVALAKRFLAAKGSANNAPGTPATLQTAPDDDDEEETLFPATDWRTTPLDQRSDIDDDTLEILMKDPAFVAFKATEVDKLSPANRRAPVAVAVRAAVATDAEALRSAASEWRRTVHSDGPRSEDGNLSAHDAMGKVSQIVALGANYGCAIVGVSDEVQAAVLHAAHTTVKKSGSASAGETLPAPTKLTASVPTFGLGFGPHGRLPEPGQGIHAPVLPPAVQAALAPAAVEEIVNDEVAKQTSDSARPMPYSTPSEDCPYTSAIPTMSTINATTALCRLSDRAMLQGIPSAKVGSSPNGATELGTPLPALYAADSDPEGLDQGDTGSLEAARDRFRAMTTLLCELSPPLLSTTLPPVVLEHITALAITRTVAARGEIVGFVSDCVDAMADVCAALSFDLFCPRENDAASDAGNEDGKDKALTLDGIIRSAAQWAEWMVSDVVELSRLREVLPSMVSDDAEDSGAAAFSQRIYAKHFFAGGGPSDATITAEQLRVAQQGFRLHRLLHSGAVRTPNLRDALAFPSLLLRLGQWLLATSMSEADRTVSTALVEKTRYTAVGWCAAVTAIDAFASAASGTPGLTSTKMAEDHATPALSTAVLFWHKAAESLQELSATDEAPPLPAAQLSQVLCALFAASVVPHHKSHATVPALLTPAMVSDLWASVGWAAAARDLASPSALSVTSDPDPNHLHTVPTVERYENPLARHVLRCATRLGLRQSAATKETFAAVRATVAPLSSAAQSAVGLEGVFSTMDGSLRRLAVTPLTITVTKGCSWLPAKTRALHRAMPQLPPVVCGPTDSPGSVVVGAVRRFDTAPRTNAAVATTMGACGDASNNRGLGFTVATFDHDAALTLLSGGPIAGGSHASMASRDTTLPVPQRAAANASFGFTALCTFPAAPRMLELTPAHQLYRLRQTELGLLLEEAMSLVHCTLYQRLNGAQEPLPRHDARFALPQRWSTVLEMCSSADGDNSIAAAVAELRRAVCSDDAAFVARTPLSGASWLSDVALAMFPSEHRALMAQTTSGDERRAVAASLLRGICSDSTTASLEESVRCAAQSIHNGDENEKEHAAIELALRSESLAVVTQDHLLREITAVRAVMRMWRSHATLTHTRTLAHWLRLRYHWSGVAGLTSPQVAQPSGGEEDEGMSREETIALLHGTGMSPVPCDGDDSDADIAATPAVRFWAERKRKADAREWEVNTHAPQLSGCVVDALSMRERQLVLEHVPFARALVALFSDDNIVAASLIRYRQVKEEKRIYASDLRDRRGEKFAAAYDREQLKKKQAQLKKDAMANHPKSKASPEAEADPDTIHPELQLPAFMRQAACEAFLSTTAVQSDKELDSLFGIASGAETSDDVASGKKKSKEKKEHPSETGSEDRPVSRAELLVHWYKQAIQVPGPASAVTTVTGPMRCLEYAEMAELAQWCGEEVASVAVLLPWAEQALAYAAASFVIRVGSETAGDVTNHCEQRAVVSAFAEILGQRTSAGGAGGQEHAASNDGAASDHFLTAAIHEALEATLGQRAQLPSGARTAVTEALCSFLLIVAIPAVSTQARDLRVSPLTERSAAALFHVVRSVTAAVTRDPMPLLLQRPAHLAACARWDLVVSKTTALLPGAASSADFFFAAPVGSAVAAAVIKSVEQQCAHDAAVAVGAPSVVSFLSGASVPTSVLSLDSFSASSLELIAALKPSLAAAQSSERRSLEAMDSVRQSIAEEAEAAAATEHAAKGKQQKQAPKKPAPKPKKGGKMSQKDRDREAERAAMVAKVRRLFALYGVVPSAGGDLSSLPGGTTPADPSQAGPSFSAPLWATPLGYALQSSTALYASIQSALHRVVARSCPGMPASVVGLRALESSQLGSAGCGQSAAGAVQFADHDAARVSTAALAKKVSIPGYCAAATAQWTASTSGGEGSTASLLAASMHQRALHIEKTVAAIADVGFDSAMTEGPGAPGIGCGLFAVAAPQNPRLESEAPSNSIVVSLSCAAESLAATFHSLFAAKASDATCPLAVRTAARFLWTVARPLLRAMPGAAVSHGQCTLLLPWTSDDSERHSVMWRIAAIAGAALRCVITGAVPCLDTALLLLGSAGCAERSRSLLESLPMGGNESVPPAMLHDDRWVDALTAVRLLCSPGAREVDFRVPADLSSASVRDDLTEKVKALRSDAAKPTSASLVAAGEDSNSADSDSAAVAAQIKEALIHTANSGGGNATAGGKIGSDFLRSLPPHGLLQRPSAAIAHTVRLASTTAFDLTPPTKTPWPWWAVPRAEQGQAKFRRECLSVAKDRLLALRVECVTALDSVGRSFISDALHEVAALDGCPTRASIAVASLQRSLVDVFGHFSERSALDAVGAFRAVRCVKSTVSGSLLSDFFPTSSAVPALRLLGSGDCPSRLSSRSTPALCAARPWLIAVADTALRALHSGNTEAAAAWRSLFDRIAQFAVPHDKFLTASEVVAILVTDFDPAALLPSHDPCCITSTVASVPSLESARELVGSMLWAYFGKCWSMDPTPMRSCIAAIHRNAPRLPGIAWLTSQQRDGLRTALQLRSSAPLLLTFLRRLHVDASRSQSRRLFESIMDMPFDLSALPDGVTLSESETLSHTGHPKDRHGEEFAVTDDVRADIAAARSFVVDAITTTAPLACEQRSLDLFASAVWGPSATHPQAFSAFVRHLVHTDLVRMSVLAHGGEAVDHGPAAAAGDADEDDAAAHQSTLLTKIAVAIDAGELESDDDDVPAAEPAPPVAKTAPAPAVTATVENSEENPQETAEDTVDTKNDVHSDDGMQRQVSSFEPSGAEMATAEAATSREVESTRCIIAPSLRRSAVTTVPLRMHTSTSHLATAVEQLARISQFKSPEQYRQMARHHSVSPQTVHENNNVMLRTLQRFLTVSSHELRHRSAANPITDVLKNAAAAAEHSPFFADDACGDDSDVSTYRVDLLGAALFGSTLRTPDSGVLQPYHTLQQRYDDVLRSVRATAKCSHDAAQDKKSTISAMCAQRSSPLLPESIVDGSCPEKTAAMVTGASRLFALLTSACPDEDEMRHLVAYLEEAGETGIEELFDESLVLSTAGVCGHGATECRRNVGSTQFGLGRLPCFDNAFFIPAVAAAVHTEIMALIAAGRCFFSQSCAPGLPASEPFSSALTQLQQSTAGAVPVPSVAFSNVTKSLMLPPLPVAAVSGIFKSIVPKTQVPPPHAPYASFLTGQLFLALAAEQLVTDFATKDRAVWVRFNEVMTLKETSGPFAAQHLMQVAPEQFRHGESPAPSKRSVRDVALPQRTAEQLEADAVLGDTLLLPSFSDAFDAGGTSTSACCRRSFLDVAAAAAFDYALFPPSLGQLLELVCLAHVVPVAIDPPSVVTSTTYVNLLQAAERFHASKRATPSAQPTTQARHATPTSDDDSGGDQAQDAQSPMAVFVRAPGSLAQRLAQLNARDREMRTGRRAKGDADAAGMRFATLRAEPGLTPYADGRLRLRVALMATASPVLLMLGGSGDLAGAELINMPSFVSDLLSQSAVTDCVRALTANVDKCTAFHFSHSTAVLERTVLQKVPKYNVTEWHVVPPLVAFGDDDRLELAHIDHRVKTLECLLRTSVGRNKVMVNGRAHYIEVPRGNQNSVCLANTTFEPAEGVRKLVQALLLGGRSFSSPIVLAAAGDPHDSTVAAYRQRHLQKLLRQKGSHRSAETDTETTTSGNTMSYAQEALTMRLTLSQRMALSDDPYPVFGYGAWPEHNLCVMGRAEALTVLGEQRQPSGYDIAAARYLDLSASLSGAHVGSRSNQTVTWQSLLQLGLAHPDSAYDTVLRTAFALTSVTVGQLLAAFTATEAQKCLVASGALVGAHADAADATVRFRDDPFYLRQWFDGAHVAFPSHATPELVNLARAKRMAFAGRWHRYINDDCPIMNSALQRCTPASLRSTYDDVHRVVDTMVRESLVFGRALALGVEPTTRLKLVVATPLGILVHCASLADKRLTVFHATEFYLRARGEQAVTAHRLWLKAGVPWVAACLVASFAHGVRGAQGAGAIRQALAAPE